MSHEPAKRTLKLANSQVPIVARNTPNAYGLLKSPNWLKAVSNPRNDEFSQFFLREQTDNQKFEVADQSADQLASPYENRRLADAVW